MNQSSITENLIHYKKTAGDFSLDAQFILEQTGITVLFGPSGSGKSMLLNCIAGIERANLAICYIDNVTYDQSKRGIHLQSHARRIGYVFQDSRLFPHMTINANLQYGYQRAADKTMLINMEDVINRFALKRYLDLYPHQLSGGQKQRVALARALLCNPKLLLLDEPLSALDFNAKQELIPYLESIHKDLTIPVIYVSHDLQEVLRLGDQIVVINEGKIIDQGDIADLCINQPLLTQAEGRSFILCGTVSHHDAEENISTVQCNGHTVLISGSLLPMDKSVRILVHARDVSLSLSHNTDTSILNILAVTIHRVYQPENGKQLVECILGITTILALLSIRSVKKLELMPGKQLYAQFKATAILK